MATSSIFIALNIAIKRQIKARAMPPPRHFLRMEMSSVYPRQRFSSSFSSGET